MNTRRQALDALCDITDRGAYANLRVKQLTSSLPEREAKLAAALVYHTLDHLLTIDYYLSHFVKGAQKPVIRGILRLGVTAPNRRKAIQMACLAEHAPLSAVLACIKKAQIRRTK